MEKKIYLVVANDEHVVCATYTKTSASSIAFRLSKRLIDELGIYYSYRVVSVPLVYPNTCQL